MNFFSPFQPKREFKVYKSCKCSQTGKLVLTRWVIYNLTNPNQIRPEWTSQVKNSMPPVR